MKSELTLEEQMIINKINNNYKGAEKERQKEIKRFQIIAEYAPYGMILIDALGNFVYINPKFKEMFGYEADEVPNGREWFSKAYPDIGYRQEVIGVWKEDIKDTKVGEKKPRIFNVTCKNGQVKTTDIITVRLEDGEFMCTFVDITERIKIEEALKESEEKFKNLVERSIAGVYILQDGVFKYVNRKFADIHGYKIEEIVGLLGPEDTIVSEDLPIIQEQIRKRLSGEIDSSQIFFRVKRKDGKLVHVEVHGSSMIYQGRRAITGTLIDITKRVEAEETIKHMAYHDTLTGLPNRALLFDRLLMALAAARRKKDKVAVMMIDIDKFKDVNDTFGHDVGDAILKIVAEGISSILRKTDTIARMGGDEFVVVLTEIASARDAAVVAGKILEMSKKPFVKGDISFSVTSSIGICIFPDNGDNPDILIKNADFAMYKAKEGGRNRVVLYK